MQEELFAKTCKICQQLKNRKTLYGHLPPRNIAELKPWYKVHEYPMSSYSKSIRQQKTGRNVIRNNARLTCMTTIDPATGWFKIVNIPTFDLE